MKTVKVEYKSLTMLIGQVQMVKTILAAFVVKSNNLKMLGEHIDQLNFCLENFVEKPNEIQLKREILETISES